jgi:PAS domain S-box-containing protein
MVQDSTEKTRENQLLEDERKRLRTLIETIPDLVCLKDTDGKYLLCNPKYERYFGVKESDIIGKSDFDFVPSELAQFFRQKDKEALDANQPLTYIEWITYADDGHCELVETIKTPMYGSDGKIIGVLGVAHNITKRFLAEKDLRKFMLGIENSSDAIFITDINGTIDFVNPAFEKIYGFSRPEALGKTPRIFKSGLISLEAYKHFWDTLLAGKPVKGELKNKTKDGRIIDIEASNNPIIDEKGDIVGFLSINRDITIRKQALSELILAKEKAEESDRLKTAFLNNISHEIRTPLNAITGFSALLTIPDNTLELQTTYIESILKGSDQLLSIISDIIDISSIEAKTTNTQISKTNLNSRIDKVFKQYLPEASEKGISLSYKNALSSEKAEIMTDRAKLVRVLSNLISNAIKFTLKGQVIFGYAPKDSFIEFFVSDTGIGIPLEFHSKIFENFYQVDKSLDRQFEGTGLGLPICKAFVEQLGGKIWLQSEPGSGSTFYFTLPFVQPVPITESITQAPESEKTLLHTQKTTLVAEDDEINFKLIKNLLETLDIKVIKAVNGIEAVNICRSQKDIDLILMDIRMPGIDGYTASKQIREFCPDVIIIAQTAYFDDKEAALKNGCNDFISKPFTREQFISKVKENLNIV